MGPWTAEMFLIFQLGRPDVWPIGDLGVRRGWGIVHGSPSDPAPNELAAAADHLEGIRTTAAWYCWRAVDVVPR